MEQWVYNQLLSVTGLRHDQGGKIQKAKEKITPPDFLLFAGPFAGFEAFEAFAVLPLFHFLPSQNKQAHWTENQTKLPDVQTVQMLQTLQNGFE